MSASATERAYRHAKERILDGRIPAGELISEGEVADDVGLSRTPVREAFLRLESEGLLRLYPKRGALVVPVSSAEVEDVIETRVLVETFAVRRIEELGIDLGEQLQRSLDAQRELLGGGDATAFVAADNDFHRMFVAAAGNAILLQLHDSLRDRQMRMGVAALAQTDARAKAILTEHQQLADHVAAGDVEAATATIEQHLDGTLRLLRVAFRVRRTSADE